MSGRRTKRLREQFENESGFKPIDRDSELYKSAWRKFKKAVK